MMLKKRNAQKHFSFILILFLYPQNRQGNSFSKKQSLRPHVPCGEEQVYNTGSPAWCSEMTWRGELVGESLSLSKYIYTHTHTYIHTHMHIYRLTWWLSGKEPTCQCRTWVQSLGWEDSCRGK